MTTLMNTAAIQQSLGLKITAEFIVDTLGVEPHSTDKRARFYTPAQFELIKAALCKHINKAKPLVLAPATSADDDDL